MEKTGMTVIVLIALLALGGCSSYQLAGEKQSVIVENILPNTFTVYFCGNAYMDQKEVEKYAFQKAAEVTLQKKFTHFIVVKKTDDSRVCSLNPPIGNASDYDSTFISSRKEVSQAVFVEPNVKLVVRCFSKGTRRCRRTLSTRKNICVRTSPG
jgi:hypothetical protein